MTALQDSQPAQQFDPTPAAARLTAAWRAGTLLTELPEAERPRTPEEGYAIQAVLLERMGEPLAGWKIAGANPRALRGETGTTPLLGGLLPSVVVDSGAVLPVPAGAKLTIEVEIGVHFRRAANPAGEAFDPAAMIDQAMITIEAVCSRFVDRKAVGIPSFIADDAGFHALVRGELLPGASASALLGAEASLWRDGAQIGHALEGDNRTDPLIAMGHLWEVFARRGTAIPQGALITTGTLIVPVDTNTPGRYEGRVGDKAVRFSIA